MWKACLYNFKLDLKSGGDMNRKLILVIHIINVPGSFRHVICCQIKLIRG